MSKYLRFVKKNVFKYLPICVWTSVVELYLF
jgi:hypothetical protein